MIVSKQTQEALMELIKQCFVENRKFDRLVSVMGVDFACNNASKLIHQGIAHYFPMLSDKIGELCLERYNISIIYGETPEGAEIYNSVTEMILVAEERIVSFQSMLMAVCKIAMTNNDFNVYSDLISIMSEFNKIVEQAILLSDKIKFYGEEKIMEFDHDINCFWILGES